VVGVLVASAVIDGSADNPAFGARTAWLYVTLLTVGYMISRGLAKSPAATATTPDPVPFPRPGPERFSGVGRGCTAFDGRIIRLVVVI
jgi:hypothetical protein